jgi:hypothetical protein
MILSLKIVALKPFLCPTDTDLFGVDITKITVTEKENERLLKAFTGFLWAQKFLRDKVSDSELIL